MYKPGGSGASCASAFGTAVFLADDAAGPPASTKTFFCGKRPKKQGNVFHEVKNDDDDDRTLQARNEV